MPVKTELIQRPTYLCSGARRSFFCRMKSGSSMSYLCSGLKSEKDMDLELCSRKKKSGELITVFKPMILNQLLQWGQGACKFKRFINSRLPGIHLQRL